MLHLPLKPTEKVDLQKALHQFIESAYSLEQADEHRDACAEVQTLRERVVGSNSNTCTGALF